MTLVNVILLMFLCILQSDISAESSPVHNLMQTALILPGHIMFLEESQETRWVLYV